MQRGRHQHVQTRESYERNVKKSGSSEEYLNSAIIALLGENDMPPTQIALQLFGHKNLKRIENYSHLSTKQQMHMHVKCSGKHF